MIGFMLGRTGEENNDFSESKSLAALQKYASLIGLDKNTGIELTEASPHVSDSMAVPSYIGQGTNSFTTSQLARYASVLANSGTVYNLTLLDKVTDSTGTVLEEYQPEVDSTINVPDNVWDDIHDGSTG